MTDYRTPARAGSALLETLAEKGAPMRRALPREAEKLSEDARNRLVFIASGTPLPGAIGAALVGGVFLSLVTLMIGAGIGAVGGAILGLLLGVLVSIGLVKLGSGSDRKAVLDALEAIAKPVRALPFPVDGYFLWLASELPIFDVTFSQPVDRRLLENALRGVDPSVTVEWVDERVARVTTAPISHAEDRTGDPALFAKLLAMVLVPLDSEVKLEKIEMGGLVRRALPAPAQSGSGDIGGTTAV